MDIRFFSDRFRHGWIVLAAILAIFTGACKKNAESESSRQTLKVFFSNSAGYTLFNRALQRTRLDSLLGGSNPFTVFAVGDSAMAAAGFSAAYIDTSDIGNLSGILRYHIIPGTLASTDVELYQETILTTADSSFQAYLEYNNFGLFYNGIPLISIDNRMVNGVVQGIQAMARPPLGDLMTTITRTPGLRDFGYFVADAVNNGNIGASYNPIIPYISGTPSAPLTIFLPSNNFYVSLGLDNYTAILQQGASATALMTKGQYFTSDFVGKNKITAGPSGNPTGNELWFSQDGYDFLEVSPSSGGPTILGHYRIVQSNIVTTSGIIQVIEPY